MEDIENEEDKEILKLKITLLGNSGVGKTSIIKKYITDEYKDNPDPTRGASYLNKIVERDNKLIQIDLWDTAGQERYRALGRHFYKNSYVIILVYDISIQESFEDLKNIWYNELLKYGEKFNILAIVGNKADLYEKEKVNEDEARAYAKEKKAVFMTVSAKKGDNIDILFNQLIDLFLSPNFQDKIEAMNSSDKGNIKLNKNGKKKKKRCC